MTKITQAAFFNKNPTFYPFRALLIENGYNLLFRPRDLEWKRFFFKLSLKPNEKVLEVGCGTGVTLLRLEKAFNIKGWGIDIAGESVKTAKKLGGEATFIQGSATDLPFPDEMFDVVYSLDVLEHIEDQKKALYEMTRVLKKNGRMLIYTINKRQKFTLNWLLGKVGVDVYESVAHDPKLFVDAREIAHWFKTKNVIVKQMAYYDAFFSLAVNSAITIFLIFLSRIGQRQSDTFYLIILRVITFLSYGFASLTWLLDIPWIMLGYSNSFFILGEKNEKKTV